MPSPEILRRVAVARTVISEELFTSIIRMERISEIITALAVTSK
jgi:hypothetical protein